MIEFIPTEVIVALISAFVSVSGSYLLFRGKKGDTKKEITEIANESVQANFQILEKRNAELLEELDKLKRVGGDSLDEKEALREEAMRLRMDIIAFASITKTIELSARQLPRLFEQLSPDEFREYLFEHQKLISDLLKDILRHSE